MRYLEIHGCASCKAEEFREYGSLGIGWYCWYTDTLIYSLDGLMVELIDGFPVDCPGLSKEQLQMEWGVSNA